MIRMEDAKIFKYLENLFNRFRERKPDTAFCFAKKIICHRFVIPVLIVYLKYNLVLLKFAKDLVSAEICSLEKTLHLKF